MSCFLWGLIPGLGQIHYGRPRRGLWFFFAFAFLLNAALVMPILVADRVVHSSIISLGVLFWLLSFVDNLSVSAESELAQK